MCASKLIVAASVMITSFAEVTYSATKITAVYEFKGGNDGASPWADLIYEGGFLYGTTTFGPPGCETQGCGTLFEINLDSGIETVLYRFKGGTDGQNPVGGLTYLAGSLFGTSSSEDGGNGAVFAFNLNSGSLKVLHSFTGGADGANPYGTLLDKSGLLYGTTFQGGKHHFGTVFKIDPKTGVLTTLHDFNGKSGGGGSYTGLVSQDGNLFGTTLGGGRSGSGVVFGVNLSYERERTIYRFNGSPDGENPFSEVTFNGGDLFGTTANGGTSESGVIYKIDPRTRTETVLYAFTGEENTGDGSSPIGALTYLNGLLYGTTSQGGESGVGTVFKVNPKTGSETVLQSFGGANGSTAGGYPDSRLLYVNSFLYGTARDGGLGYGTVFKITP